MKTEEEILKQSKSVAIVGLSNNPERASHHVGSYLKEKGYQIIPVNPGEKMILGEVCYPDLASIPEPVDCVDIFRKSADVPPVVKEAIRCGAKAVWMQEGVAHPEAAREAEKAGLKVVMNKCMLKEHARLLAAGK
jgi:predicted CoA-binding protein